MPNNDINNRALAYKVLQGLNPAGAQKALRSMKMQTITDNTQYAVMTGDSCCPSKKSGKGKILSPALFVDTCYGVGSFNAQVIADTKLNEYSPSKPTIDLRVPYRYSDDNGSDVNFSPPTGDFRQYKLDGLMLFFPATAGVALSSLINITIKGFTDGAGLNPAATDYEQSLQVTIDDISRGATVVVGFRDQYGNHFPLNWNNQFAIDGTTNVIAKPYSVSIQGYPTSTVDVIHAPLNSNFQLSVPAEAAFVKAYGG